MSNEQALIDNLWESDEAGVLTNQAARELEQLRQENKRLLDDNKRMSARKLELCQERDELVAHSDRLLKALIETHWQKYMSEGMSTTQARMHAENICPKISPSTSLAQHDNEVIEMCAEAVYGYTGRPDEYAGDTIRALKTGESDEQI